MQTEMPILHPWHEVVGTVDSVENYEEKVVLRISSIRRIALEIPLDELMENDLNLAQLKGLQITILRTNEAYILKLSKQDGDSKSKAL
jgi:hypothetical protein